MSALRELQRRFQAAILDDPDEVLGHLSAAAGGPSARERLDVYAEGIQLRYLEVLRSDFPGVRSLCGDEEFATVGRAYARACPSRRPSIRWFGARLAAFLSSPPWVTRPVLAEMAAFEWAKGELHDAADGPVVAVHDVLGVAPEGWAALRPCPRPAVRRLDLHWNVPAIWSTVDRGDPYPVPACSPSPRAWLLWRTDLQVHWRSLDHPEAWAFDACAGGATFGEVCAGLAERVGEAEAPMRAASALKQWLSDGVIRSV